MHRVYLAELRDSWSAWLGVSIVFIGVNAVLASSALVIATGTAAVMSGELNIYDSTAFVFLPIFYCLTAGLVGLSTIGSATNLVVETRRGALARLALAGATPKQIKRSVTLQLIVVSLACAAVADVFAALSLPSVLRILATDRTEVAGFTPVPVYDIGAVIATNLITVAIAVLGGRWQARRASELFPVDALRQASTGESLQRGNLGRWLKAGCSLTLVAGTFLAMPAILQSSPPKEVISNTMLLALIAMLVTAAALGTLSPILTAPITRGWTALLPLRSAVWQLARRNVSARGERLARSVVPVMMSVSLLVSLSMLGPTIFGSLEARGIIYEVEQAGSLSMAILVAPALIVAVCGSVGSLFMMSKQRDAELALTGLIGGTPRQRLALPAVEALMITVTATIMAIPPIGVLTMLAVMGLSSLGVPALIVFPADSLAMALGFTGLVTLFAIWLPTLPALNVPERRVIARLIAE